MLTSDSIDALNFETSALKFINEPTKRGRSISTREDIFVHEQPPDKVLLKPMSVILEHPRQEKVYLKLPRLSQTSDLQEEDSIILEHVVDLTQEGSKVSNTNVFGHFQASNLIIPSSGDRGIAVIHAQNLRLRFFNSITAEARVPPCGLVAAKSDTGNVGAIVPGSETSESTPSAAKVEHTITVLEVNFLANDLEFVVLELFERFLLVDVGNNTGSVDHAWAQEPAVEVITAIIMVTNLLFVYCLG